MDLDQSLLSIFSYFEGYSDINKFIYCYVDIDSSSLSQSFPTENNKTHALYEYVLR